MSESVNQHVITWENPPGMVNPPPLKQNTLKWDAIAKTLKENPGRWAQVETEDEVYPSGSKARLQAALTRRGMRTVLRVNSDGTGSVWAMHPGDDS